jgi:type IV pilus assembly protein PilF
MTAMSRQMARRPAVSGSGHRLRLQPRSTANRAEGGGPRVVGQLASSLLIGTALSVGGFSIGCAGKGPAGAGPDPERQSRAEHDVAADALSKGNLRSALAHAKKAAELDEDNADAHLLVATVYIAFCSYSPDECRLGDAEKAARMAVKKKDPFREAQNTLGAILIHEKKYDEAIKVLQALTEDMLYATPENAWGNLGWAYLEKGELDRAVDALRRAVAAQPDFCWGNTKLGLAYEKKGDLRAAQQALSKAIDTSRPECNAFPDALELRARVLTKLGEEDGARADLERCSKVGAGSPAGQRCAASLGKTPAP